MHQTITIIVFIIYLTMITFGSFGLRTLQKIRETKHKMPSEAKTRLNMVLASTIAVLVLSMNVSIHLGQWVYPNNFGNFHVHGVFMAAMFVTIASIVSSRSLTQFIATFISVVPSFLLLDKQISVIMIAPIALAVLAVTLHVLLPRIGLIQKFEDIITQYIDRKVLSYFQGGIVSDTTDEPQ